MEGYQIVAQSLANNGVKYMFGVVGIPVVEVAIAAQRSSSSHIFTNPEPTKFFTNFSLFFGQPQFNLIEVKIAANTPTMIMIISFG